jgi:hypothetical protein
MSICRYWWTRDDRGSGTYITSVGSDTGSVSANLVRLHSLTNPLTALSISVVQAEVVLADGSIKLIDAEHESDLFWVSCQCGGLDIYLCVADALLNSVTNRQYAALEPHSPS